MGLGATWLLGTTAGARWSLRAVSKWSPVRIEAKEVDGRLWDDLRLEGVRAGWPEGRAEVGALRLRWNPAALLRGEVAFEDLSLRQVRVEDERPREREPLDLTWPSPEGLLSRLDVRARLSLEDFSYRRLSGEPFLLSSLEGRLHWDSGTLSLRDVAARSPAGGLEGSLEAGFVEPSLTADVRLLPAEPLRGLEALVARVRLAAAPPRELLSGTVELGGVAGGERSVILEGELALRPKAIELERFLLTERDRSGSVAGHGRISFDEVEPHLRLALRPESLDLSPELRFAHKVSGTVEVEGRLDRYRGSFRLENEGSRWRGVAVASPFHGGGEELSLTEIRGAWLGGTLRGRVSFSWSEGISLSGSLEARGLDPAEADPDWWGGSVNFDVEGRARRPRGGTWAGGITGDLRESRLRGRLLTGGVDAGFTGRDLRVRRAVLRGRGFALAADGALRERVRFRADVTDLSGLVPRAEGALDARGWIGLRGHGVAGEVEARGEEVSIGDAAVASLRLAAALPDRPRDPLHLAAQLRGAAYRGHRAELLDVTADGTRSRHRIAVRVRDALPSDLDLDARLTGSWGDGRWRGRLAALEGSDAMGPFRLDGSAGLVLSSQRVSISDGVLVGRPGERLELSGELRGGSESFVRAAWREVELRRANPWLGEAAIAGASSGELSVRWRGQDLLSAELDASARGAFTGFGERFEGAEAAAELSWTDAGLRATARLASPSAGNLSVRATSAERGRLGLPPRGSLRISADRLDPGLLRRWFPEGFAFDGRLDGRAEGTWSEGRRFDVEGRLATTPGGLLAWRFDGRDVRARVQRAETAWTWRGAALSGTVDLALEGHGRAGGSFRVPLPASWPIRLERRGPLDAAFRGELEDRGLAGGLFPRYLLDSRGSVEFDLRAGGTPADPELRGTVRVAEAGAGLPDQGIRLEGVRALARFSGNRVRVESFEARSGPGHLRGFAELLVGDGRIARLAAELRGDRFQVLAGPDLSVFVSPDLRVEGSSEKLVFVGEIGLPELGGEQTPPALEASLTAELRPGRLDVRRLELARPDREGTVTVTGTVSFPEAGPALFQLGAKARELDLSPEVPAARAVSGELGVEGSTDDYRGRLTLSSRGEGWQGAELSLAFEGTSASLAVRDLRAGWLDGSLRGALQASWEGETAATWTLTARGLNPALFGPQWRGAVGFDAQGTARKPEGGGWESRVGVALVETRLRGSPLAGELKASTKGDDVSLERLALQGTGLRVSASGELDRAVSYQAEVADLSAWLAEADGSFEAEGRVRRADGGFSGELSLEGRGLRVAGYQAERVTAAARLGDREGNDFAALSLRAEVTGFARGSLRARRLAAVARGSVARHELELEAEGYPGELRVSVAGAYGEGGWRGRLTELSGRDPAGPWSLVEPADLVVTREEILLSPLVVAGAGEERLELAADVALTGEAEGGEVRVRWKALDVARANSWLQEVEVEGRSSGEMGVRWAGGRVEAEAEADVSGAVTLRRERFTLSDARLALHWDAGGLRSSLDASFGGGGSLSLAASSPSPGALRLPERGRFTATLDHVRLGLLQAFLPEAIALDAPLSGEAEGRWFPENAFSVSGTLHASEGSARWRADRREYAAQLRNAELRWTWSGSSLEASADLQLAEYGRASGAVRLPLPARLPLDVDRKAPVSAALEGEVRERGLLSALLPAFAQESHGELSFALRAGGTLGTPDLSGSLRLSRAGAYLPPAGIRLEEVSLSARLEGQRILVESFAAKSGPGRLEGTAELQLEGASVAAYRATLRGERFQFANVPELRALATPDLQLQGEGAAVSIRGEVAIPELLFLGRPGAATVEESEDVVFVDRRSGEARRRELPLEARVTVTLGKEVRVRARGIDARLEGSVQLVVREEELQAYGTIRAVEGRYSTYGVTLPIERGRVFFAGPPDSAALDVLAVRKEDDVRAGVTVTGTVERPVVSLYSEPAMPDGDILAYVVLGHPLGQDREQANRVARAASLLLSGSQALGIQNQLKRRLGVDVIGLETRRVTPAEQGTDGEPAPEAAPGPGGEEQGAIEESVVTVGKQLTPKLFVSYGRALLTGENLFKVRYDLSKKWTVETQTGGQTSGVDLYYQIQFD